MITMNIKSKVNLFVYLILCLSNFSSIVVASDNKISRVDLVDMFMGVQGASNCVVGPQLPHGSINPSPQTAQGSHSGYRLGQPIRGFGQLHPSGIGWGRYGQIFLSPQIGFNANEDGHDSEKAEEIAKPYYYSVFLKRYGIKTEITPTHHCASYRFTFPDAPNANILLDIAHNIPQHIVPIVGGRFLDGNVSYNKENRLITGWGEYSGGFGDDAPYKVYFAIHTDDAIKDVVISENIPNTLYAQLKISENPETVCLNVGISFKSVENAIKYIDNEIAEKDFDTVCQQAKAAWVNVFDKITVKGGTEEEQRIFYTALYHSYVMPRDRTGDNPNWESEYPHFDDHYCVWDTWRTKFPLMILLNESFVGKVINSFIDRFEHNGKCMPTFTSSLEWDWKQGGDDVDNIIADAFVKNVGGFDKNKAYNLVKSDAFKQRSPAYIKYGWEPEPAERMSCSYTMEYAYNDFCVATVARFMGDSLVANQLSERATHWVNLFNPNLESHGFKGFIAPRTESGKWIEIDPAHRYGSWVEYFYEGNSWVYTLFVPHQFDRLVELCGGKENMVRRLSFGFDHDLIELDNEPGFLSPFIFTHCDRPDLTAKYVDKIRKNHFSLATGYPENEDSGAMGAWYIFTSIGFFPNAGQDFYYLLPPAFPEITIEREGGEKIFVQTKKMSPEATKLAAVYVNGRKVENDIIRHADIAKGCTILYVFE